MIETPSAVWFTSGSPQRVQQDVKATVQRAAAKGQVPVLVAYNVPGRDCSQYSAGGAPTGDAYRAWIDGFVAGLGDAEAVVIVEPDGLALQPTDCGQPDTFDRVALINYAVDALAGNANAHVYLDAGHSAWHNVGDIASRLVAGGVLTPTASTSTRRTTSSRRTSSSSGPGSRVHRVRDGARRRVRRLPEPVLERRPAELGRRRPEPVRDLERHGGGRRAEYVGRDTRYASMLGDTSPPTTSSSTRAATAWVRGSPRPTTPPATRRTGATRPIAARASCRRRTPGSTSWMPTCGLRSRRVGRPVLSLDVGADGPVRGTVDPAAGEWFADMALELARNAQP